MDFIDQLKQFASRVERIKDAITTEEATKNALVLPFFQLLGYDVFNPFEFVPEFTADVGIKKGEKVDYAIVIDGNPVILIETKWVGEKLEAHDSQLFRYFGTTSAKFGILTNGLIYRFYTDLDEANKMDLTPFMEINLLDIKEGLVAELKRFTKGSLDVNAAFTAALELKYTMAVKNLIHKQRTQPDEHFVNYVLGEIYPGRRTQAVVDRFTEVIRRGLNLYIGDVINDTLKSAIQSQSKEKEKEAQETDAVEEVPRILTTEEELQGFMIIKSILTEIASAEDVSYRDTESYFAINLMNNTRKWVCRLFLNSERKYIGLPNAEGKEERIPIENTDDLFKLKDRILEAAKLRM